MLLAAQLSRFAGIRTCIVERREGPLKLGQADGVACRTVEMFEAFGLSERLARESYWVNETVFWRPSTDDPSRIVRTGRVQDVEDGLSEFPHVIVNQARLLQYLQEYMAKSPTRLVPDFGWAFETLTIDAQGDYPSPRPCATSRRTPRKPCVRNMSWAATAREARCGRRSARRRKATSPTTPGAWSICSRSRIFPISG